MPKPLDNQITWQLGHFKYHDLWSVYPMGDGRVLVFGDIRGVGCFDHKTGRGRFTHVGTGYSDLANASTFQFPPEFVSACLAVCPSLGGESEINGHVFNHTVMVLKKGSI